MHSKFKRIVITSIIAIYLSSGFLQNLSFFPFAEIIGGGKVYAADEKITETINIIPILVESSIYDSIESDLKRYTTNYIQKNLSNTKALVLPINTEIFTAPEITKMLENIYFDGIEKQSSNMIGLILIGKIPLPVVNQEGFIYPTIYPYVDFLEQKYIRDPETKYFTYNNNAYGQAEIRHGLIDYGNDTQAYHDFFAKIKKYQEDPENFTEKRIRYEDFIANQIGFLPDNLQYYQNKILFAEDLGYLRYTPLMLNLFKGAQNENVGDITQDLAETYKELGIDMGTGLDGLDQLTNIGSVDKNVPTKTIEKSVKEGFLLNYAKLFGSQTLSLIRANVEAGGRRLTGYQASGQQAELVALMDSSYLKISQKDDLIIGNNNFQGILVNFNNRLEEAVDKKITKEKYDMDLVIPVSYRGETSRRKRGKCIKAPEQFDFYFFGTKADLITEAQEMSIYRGTFRNLKNLDGVSTQSIQNSTNPSKTILDTTKLENKGIGSSYDIFSTQIEANRGFNTLSTQEESEYYEHNKTYRERHTECTKRRPFKRLKLRCKKTEEKPIKDKGECHPGDYDMGNDGGCENPTEFAMRWRGGASPMNLDFTGMQQGIYKLLDYNPKSARSSIFDIAGSVKLEKNSDQEANSFKGLEKYIAANNIYYTEGGILYHSRKGTDKGRNISQRYFFNLGTDKLSKKVSTKGNILELSNDGGCGTTKRKYTYKILDSKVKNTATTALQLNGINTTVYGTGSPLEGYYSKILQGISSIDGDLDEVLSGINSVLSGIVQAQSGINNLSGGNLLTTKNFVESQLNAQKIEFENVYGGFDSLSASTIFDALNYIKLVEEETLKNGGKITFKPERITQVEIQTNALKTKFRNIQTKYGEIDTNYNNLIQTYNPKYILLATGSTLSLADGLKNSIQSFSGQHYPASGEEEAQTVNFLYNQRTYGKDNFIIELTDGGTVTWGADPAEEQIIINKSETALETFKSLFKGEPNDNPLKIPGINFLTPDRPIDSPRYITFQGVATNDIKLIYPNVFKIEVYSGTGNKKTLKTIPEIKESIKTYLINKTNEYNLLLTTEKNKTSPKPQSHYNVLTQKGFSQATPTRTNNEYKPFEVKELIDALGGEEGLDIIAELLYFQSITNKEKEYNDSISQDINNVKDSFNLNNKVEYTLGEFLTKDKTKSPVILPGYQEKGYEVGYFNSNGSDSIETATLPTFIEQAQTQNNTFNQSQQKTAEEKNKENSEAELAIQEKCGVDPDGSALIFDIKKMNSPWLEAFMCWIEELKETPFKITLDYSESLGPTLGDQSLGDFLGESTKNWMESMQQYGMEREERSGKKESSTNITNATLEANIAQENAKNMEDLPPDQQKKLQDAYNYVNARVSHTTINDKKDSTDLTISSPKSDIGTVKITVSGTGSGCFSIQGKDICNGKQTFLMNPYQKPETLTVKMTQHKIGSFLMIIEICPTGMSTCVKKTHNLGITPGELDHFTITGESNKAIAGVLTPITITARDKNENKINQTLTDYLIKIDAGQLQHNGVKSNELRVNDRKDTGYYFIAPKDFKNGGNISIQILSHTGQLITTNSFTIYQGFPKITLNNKEFISPQQTTGSLNITLGTGNTLTYKDAKGANHVDERKLQKFVLFLNDGNNQSLNINTEINLKSQNNLFKIGEVITEQKTSGNEKITNENFRQRSKIKVENGKATFYLYPNTKAGSTKLTVEIPGLKTFEITVNILNAPAQVVEIVSEKETLKAGETTQVQVAVKDIWGNPVQESTILDLSKTNNIKLSGVGNKVIVSKGNLSFSAEATEVGNAYITAKLNTGDEKKQKIGIANIMVQGSLIPTDNLNIMYLNMFGDDRGNQRGYFSDNKKFSENIMKNSEKAITTTTNLISPDKIKKVARLLSPNFQIQKYENLPTTLQTENGKVQIKIKDTATITTNISNPKLNQFLPSDDLLLESILTAYQNNTENTIIFIPVNTDTKLSENKIISAKDGRTVLDLSQNIGTVELLDQKVGDFNTWIVKENGTQIGRLFLSFPKEKTETLQPKMESSEYGFTSVFTNGSTDNQSALGIYNKSSNLGNLNQGYLSIQNSNDPNNFIGFRGDFKNMTLYAQGEIVGNATKHFGSDFLINIGDPLLKKFNENLEIKNTDFDGGFGQTLFSEPGKTILKVKAIDFNNDSLKDFIIAYTDGSVKILKNYGGTTPFRNLEHLLMLATGIKDIFIGDVDKNGYEDIIIQTTNNQLRIYLNHGGIFDVDGNPACLNTNIDFGETTKTPEEIDQVHQIFVEDMDKDGAIDIITNDTLGFIKIFYGGSTNGYGNYISKDKVYCDTGWTERSIPNTNIIRRFGVAIDESNKVVDNSLIRRDGLSMPEETEINAENPEEFGVNIDQSILDKLSNIDSKSNINLESLLNDLGPNNFNIGEMAQAGLDTSLKYVGDNFSARFDDLPKEKSAFIPIGYLEENDNLIAYKKYKNLNGKTILTHGDKVEVSVIIQAKKNFEGTFADSILGPWKISTDTKGKPTSLKLPENQKNIKILPSENGYTYILDNIKLNNGETLTYTYTLEYQNTELQKINIEDLEGNDFKIKCTKDGYPDITVQPTDGCNKSMETFINSKTEKNRKYNNEFVDLQALIDEYTQGAQDTQEDANNSVTDAISSLGSDVGNIGNIPGLEDALQGFNLKELLGQSLNGGFNLNVEFFGKELDAVTAELDKIAEGLCKGFTFGGNSPCPGLPVPFNQAFLAPGDYHLFGCIKLPLVPLNKGVPIFSFPTYGPVNILGVPVPPFWPINFQGAGGIFEMAGKATSMFRIYVAPTLTAQVGVAVCLGPYDLVNIPSPFAELGGNCIVTVIRPQCKGKGGNGYDEDNPNETYNPWINQIGNTNSCNATPKGPKAVENGYSPAPFISVSNNGYSRGIGSEAAYTPNIPEGQHLFGYLQLEMDPIISSLDSEQNGIFIGGVKIDGGGATANKILGGLQQGIRKMLIDNWLDPQIKYIASNLSKMDISVKWPDLSKQLSDGENILNTVQEAISNIGKNKKNLETNLPTNQKVENMNQKKGLSSEIFDNTAATINNPFEQLAATFSETDLITINTKNLAIKVPMIFSEDINSYEQYLKQRAVVNTEIVEKRTAILQATLGICGQQLGIDTSNKTPREIRTEGKDKINGKNQQQENKKDKVGEACMSIFGGELASKIQEFINITEQFSKLLENIYHNIKILQEYRNFPFELYERVHVIDRYMTEIGNISKNFIGYLAYWMQSNANRYSQYVDAILTVMAAIKTYQILVDFSMNRSSKCGTCTNDTYDQYACKLSMLCPDIGFPILEIPPFKIPDILIDFSDINIGLDILLPKFHFQAISVDLPSIPNLPEPPVVDINMDFDFLFSLFDLPNLPNIPELPSPPKLPELPSFIPNITMELPVLPPAPKIPALSSKIEGVIKIAEKIGRIYCIVKQGIGLVGEGSVKAKIEQLSQRTYEVPYVDNIINFAQSLKFKKPTLKGFDYQIEAMVDVQYNFTDVYAAIEAIVNLANQGTTEVEGILNKRSYEGGELLQKGSDSVNETVEKGNTNINIGYNENNKNLKNYQLVATDLQNTLQNFLVESSDENLKKDISSILQDLKESANIEGNFDGINQTKNTLEKTIQDSQNESKQLASLIETDYDSFLKNISKQKENKETPETQLTLSTNLFKTTEKTKQKITTMKNPYQMIIDAKVPAVDGYLNALTNGSPESLNMSEEKYLLTYSYLHDLKTQINGLYTSIQPNTTTKLIAKNTEKTSEKTLTAGNNNTSSSSSAGLSIDISSYVNGVFVRNKNGKQLSNVVYSEENYKKIGKNYYTLDVNQDTIDDVLLRDKSNIYVKYGTQKEEYKGIKKLETKYYVQTIENIPNNISQEKEKYITFDNSTKIKTFDNHREVKNFKMQGQSFDSITFSRTKNKENAIAGYLIKLNDRVDSAREKSDLKEKAENKKYVLVVPKDTPLSGEKINLEGNIYSIDEAFGKKLIEIGYYVNNATVQIISTTLENIDRKRQYGKITTLSKKGTEYNIESPRSNQILAGRQIIGDDEGPEGTAILRRKKLGKLIDTGDELEGFIGTHYSIILNRKDNVAIKNMKIEHNGKVIKTGESTEQKASIILDNLFFTGATTQNYIFSAEDKEGNISEKEVTLTIKVPTLEITDIQKVQNPLPNLAEAAIITTTLESDIDEGGISFERQRNKKRAPLKGKGEEKTYYELAPNITTITGAYYDIGNEIGLFGPDEKLMANINPNNGEISILPEYKNKLEIKVDFSSHSPIIQIIDKEKGKKLFNIIFPSKEIVSLSAPTLTVSDLKEKFGNFNGGKALHTNGTNILFVGPTGEIYTDQNLYGEYKFNKEKETIEYLIKFSELGSIIATIEIKVEPLKNT